MKSESGFMGHTHALSAVAVWLLLVALIPDIIFNNILKTSDLIVFIASIIIVTGFGLMPDFDNTKSTAISVLGPIGYGISQLMRSSAVAIYHISRGPRDDTNPNPHRGFWHTLVSSLVMGLIVMSTTSIPIPFTLPVINKTVTLGFLFATLWIYICFKIGIAGLFSKFYKKLKTKGILFKLTIELLAIILSISILLLAPGTLSYTWMAYSAIIGYSLHILGDTFTVAGTPLLYPFKNKGKRWWTYRFSKIRAGGTVENYILIPAFITIIIFSLLKIFLKF